MFIAAAPAYAGDVDVSKLSKKKQTTLGLYLSAKEAYDEVTSDQGGVLFIDVRTQAELEFIGAPTMIDANVPYMLNDFSEWDGKKKRFLKVPNSNFTVLMEEQLKVKGLTKNDKVILMCRSGSRSAKAVNLLHKAGYKQVYTVVDGFEGDKSKAAASKGQRVVNGWKNAKLPWTYKHDETKMYVSLD
jgi:rhodanese-related sulfurtransferase